MPYEALFDWGAESEGQKPKEILKFRVSEMPFPGLWGIFDRLRSDGRNLQFSSTKWAKAYLTIY